MRVTRETEMSQMAKALAAGANDYVMKSFAKEVIAAKLAMLGVMAYKAALQSFHSFKRFKPS